MRKHRIWYGVILIMSVIMYIVANNRSAVALMLGLILVPVICGLVQLGAMRKIRITYNVRKSCRIGQEMVLEIKLKRASRLPMGAIHLHMQMENILFSDKFTRTIELQPTEKKEQIFLYPLQFETCGDVQLKVVQTTYYDLTGLFCRRKKEEVEKLWKYVNDGSVDYIGSDHGPFLLSEKETGYEDIFKAPAGFPGIDLRLPLMLDAAQKGKLSIDRVIELLVTNPAKIFKLFPQKGAIRIGSDADFVGFTLDEGTVVKKENSYSKAKDIARCYDGWKLDCKLLYTIVRGRVIMKDGVVDEKAKAYGELVKPVK